MCEHSEVVWFFVPCIPQVAFEKKNGFVDLGSELFFFLYNMVYSWTDSWFLNCLFSNFIGILSFFLPQQWQ